MAAGRVDLLVEIVGQHPVATAAVAAMALAMLAYTPARLLGYARISYYHAADSLQLAQKDYKKNITFAELCKTIIPTCRLNPLLANGHLQTAMATSSGKHVPVHYKRHVFEQLDPVYTGTFAVDFVVKPNQDEDKTLPPRTTYYTDQQFRTIASEDTRPMLIALHGLAGGSQELYLRECLAPLVKNGWEACVVISRGCSRTKITSSVLYNARATWDIRQFVKWARENFPNRPLFGIGFSLGANIITNYVGEEGEACPLKAAVAVSNVWNNEVASLGLQRTWIGRKYDGILGKSMIKVFERHFEQISEIPGLDVQKVRSAKSLHEFDRYLQGPTWGYPTEGAYYRDASSIDAMMGIRIPFLGISAEDDPIVCAEALPYEESKATPYVVLCATSLGGHLGWFKIGGARWFAEATTAFFQKMAQDIDLDAYSRSAPSEVEARIAISKREPLRPYFIPARRRLALSTD